MKCFTCILEGREFGAKAAETVYKGTAYCVEHAIRAELEDKRESTIAVMPQPKRAR